MEIIYLINYTVLIVKNNALWFRKQKVFCEKCNENNEHNKEFINLKTYIWFCIKCERYTANA